jgi:hypothetical protein
MSLAGNRILRSVRQARVYARGETTDGFILHARGEGHKMTDDEVAKMLIDPAIPLDDDTLQLWIENSNNVLDHWFRKWGPDPSWHWSKSVLRLVAEVKRLKQENAELCRRLEDGKCEEV